MSERKAKKVLLIGWDAADWKVINPLLDQGLMPTLNKIVTHGIVGNMATLDPPLSPILWTSIATGKLADKHGVLGFVEPDTKNMTVRPVLGTSRKVKAIWNILSQSGLKSNVIGWWPSHPAEPINGAMVSNFFQNSKDFYGKEWPLAPGTIYPKELEGAMSELRIHQNEISSAHVFPFVPEAAKLQEASRHKRLMGSISKILAHCSSIHNAATYLMRNTEWDFTAVYFDAIDHFCHGFMKFHPPHRQGIPKEYYDLYKDVVNSAYRFHDMMLERLIQIAGEDTTVIIMSDHGFHSDHLRPNKLPKEPASPAYEHSPYGIICMKGEHILKDQRLYGATLLDVTPTVLTLFGLPVGKDMDGKVLVQAFDAPVQPEFIESWETVEGNAGMHPGDEREDPWAAKEAMDQLVALGYVEAMGDDMKKNFENITRESQWYLARVYMYKKQYYKAIEILEKIYEEKNEVRYGLSLIRCYQLLRKVPEFRSMLNKLRALDTKSLVQLDMMEGALLLMEYEPRKALETLLRAEEKSSHSPHLYSQIGRIYMRSNHLVDAERAFMKALSIDPQNSTAHDGLAAVFIRQGKYEEAAESAINAIGLMYQYPLAHFHLGEALMNLGDFERAAEAFEVCCFISPGSRKAHQWLIHLYEEKLNRPDKALEHQQFLKDKIKGTITVVSGLPRSGTSMMMQMLEHGGLKVLTDESRQPDENNPKGYLEYEKVKKLMTEATWLQEATGKVVKIVAPLLRYLPPRFEYKIIFMHREMDEVLRSQQIMLGKKEEVQKNAYPAILAEAFKKQLEQAHAWITQSLNVQVLFLDYSSVVENPEENIERVIEFLDEDLDLEAMTKCVDKSLYRNVFKKNYS